MTARPGERTGPARLLPDGWQQSATAQLVTLVDSGWLDDDEAELVITELAMRGAAG